MLRMNDISQILPFIPYINSEADKLLSSPFCSERSLDIELLGENRDLNQCLSEAKTDISTV